MSSWSRLRPAMSMFADSVSFHPALAFYRKDPSFHQMHYGLLYLDCRTLHCLFLFYRLPPQDSDKWFYMVCLIFLSSIGCKKKVILTFIPARCLDRPPHLPEKVRRYRQAQQALRWHHQPWFATIAPRQLLWFRQQKGSPVSREDWCFGGRQGWWTENLGGRSERFGPNCGRGFRWLGGG